MRLWVGLPVPDKPGQYDLRPVEVDYSRERLRRLYRFPLLLSLGLAVFFGAAAAVLAGLRDETAAGWALGVMAVGAVVSAVVFILQLRRRNAVRREPEKFAKFAFLAFDAKEGEAAFTEDELAERTGEP
ncbi:MAG: hypothetical protein NTW26_08465 [bacterium]|nr:hypothetical protein [bacterium]